MDQGNWNMESCTIVSNIIKQENLGKHADVRFGLDFSQGRVEGDHICQVFSINSAFSRWPDARI